jgi:hypothetical protein
LVARWRPWALVETLDFHRYLAFLAGAASMGDVAADGFGRLATAKIKAKPDDGGPAALPGVQCDLWEG